MTSVLKKLIDLRCRRSLTQADVARKMGVSRQQINNIESGRQGDPSIRTIERYAKAIKARIEVVSSR